MPLTLTISIKDLIENTEIIDAISNSLTKGPPVATTQIAPLYEVFFDKSTQYFSFSFADELALSGEAGEDDLAGLQIRVTSNTISAAVEIS